MRGGEQSCDWRRQGQEAYLKGVRLTRCHFEQVPGGSDHEHCEFCYQKISSAAEDIQEAWTTLDRYRWVCDTCFRDFVGDFEWIIDAE